MIIKEVPTCISDTIYSLRSEYDAMQNDAARWRSSRVVDGNDLIPGWLGLFARWCSTHGFNIDKNFPADPDFRILDRYWTADECEKCDTRCSSRFSNQINQSSMQVEVHYLFIC
jgi:hypothetical protein